MRYAVWLILACGVGGCAAERTVPAAGPSEKPAALVNGRAVGWERLRPGLAELAGGQVLEEAVLDELLERRCQERGIVVDQAMVAAERALLIESLDPSPDRAEDLLRVIRSSRRLGDERFSALLRRSAMLRALVGPVKVPEAAVAQAVALRTGERSVVRIIGTRTEADAAAARELVGTGAGGVVDPMRFATVAADVSTDESAARGGLVEPISAEDSNLPAALRRAVTQTQTGKMTPIVSTGEGFLVALVERRLPAREPLSVAEVDALRRELGVRMQRVEMERLGREVLLGAEVVPMDRGLGWSWSQRGK